MKAEVEWKDVSVTVLQPNVGMFELSEDWMRKSFLEWGMG